MRLLDVVVVEYHAEDDLSRCLTSIEELSDSERRLINRIVVVKVDAEPMSAADTAIMMRMGITFTGMGAAASWQLSQMKMGGLEVEVLRVEENCGYARACNLAADYLGSFPSVGKYLLLLNTDTRLADGVLHSCVKGLEANPLWAVVGPRQVNSLGQITHAGVSGTNTKPVLRGWMKKSGFEILDEECVSVSGSAYFIRRRVWDEIAEMPEYREAVDLECTNPPGVNGVYPLGAFLPAGLLYYEETACSYIVRSLGYKVVYNGHVTMTHEWHGSIGKESKRQDVEWSRSSRDTFRRVMGRMEIPCD